MDNAKKWYRSKTIWTGILEVIGGISLSLAAEVTAGTALTVSGILTIILRVVTKSGLVK